MNKSETDLAAHSLQTSTSGSNETNYGSDIKRETKHGERSTKDVEELKSENNNSNDTSNIEPSDVTSNDVTVEPFEQITGDSNQPVIESLTIDSKADNNEEKDDDNQDQNYDVNRDIHLKHLDDDREVENSAVMSQDPDNDTLITEEENEEILSQLVRKKKKSVTFNELVNVKEVIITKRTSLDGISLFMDDSDDHPGNYKIQILQDFCYSLDIFG